MKTIKLADWSTTPGHRHKKDGEFSAEQWYEDVVRPAFMDAYGCGEFLTVILDGTSGVTDAFIEEAFVLLMNDFPYAKHRIFFISHEDPELLENISNDLINS